MNNEEIIKDLSNIVNNVLGRSSTILSMDTIASDIEGWDSLTNVKILYECELKWGIRLTFEQLSSLSCVGDLVEMIIKGNN